MLTDYQRQEAARLFRSAGYHRPLRIAAPLGDDERVFVVEEDVLATLPYNLAARLQQVLGRKVWITAGPGWEETEPLR